MITHNLSCEPNIYNESESSTNVFWFTIANNTKCLYPAFRCKDFFQEIFLKLKYPKLPNTSVYKFKISDTILKANKIVMYHPLINLQNYKPNITNTLNYIKKTLNTTLALSFENHKAIFSFNKNITNLPPALLSYLILCLRISPFFEHSSVSDFVKNRETILTSYPQIYTPDITTLTTILPTIINIEQKKFKTESSQWPQNIKNMTSENDIKAHHNSSGIRYTHIRLSLKTPL